MPAARKPAQLRRRKTVDPKVLKDIVARVVEVAKPDRIIMFGSAARGTMGPHSDVDLLVINTGRFDHYNVAAKIYSALSRSVVPVDVVLATPKTLKRYGDAPCLIYYPALREGCVLYGN